MKINEIQTGLPLRTATQIEITIQAFKTDTNLVMTYYELKDNDNYKVCDGYYQLSETQYDIWGADNTYIEDCVLNYLGLERYGYIEPIPIDKPINLPISGSTSGTTIQIN